MYIQCDLYVNNQSIEEKNIDRSNDQSINETINKSIN